MTEDELRAALRSRTDSVPATPGLAQHAEQQGRRQQAGIRTAGAAGLVAALAIAAVVALPRTTATPTPPATGSPTASPSSSVSGTQADATFTTTATVLGLRTEVTGPSVVDGSTPFELTVVVTNPDSAPEWTGTVAAGLLYQQRVPGWFDGDLVMPTGEGNQLGAALPESLTSQAFGGVMAPEGAVTFAPGQQRTWTFRLQRDLRVPDDGEAQGWVAMLTPQKRGSESGVDPASARRITFTPAESNLPCASVSIASYDEGAKGPWQLSQAYTAVVGADRKATWTEVQGLGIESIGFTSTREQEVLPTVVGAALQEAGLAGVSGFGPPAPERPATLAPGRYVVFSGAKIQPVAFAGSCGDGAPISGTYDHTVTGTVGELDCSTTPPADSLGVLARKYCPKG